MIKIDLETISSAIRELQHRTLINIGNGEVDWFRILADLKSAGLSNAEVARRLRCHKSNVMRWKSGSTPMWPEALALLQLHHSVIEKVRNSQPNQG